MTLSLRNFVGKGIIKVMARVHMTVWVVSYEIKRRPKVINGIVSLTLSSYDSTIFIQSKFEQFYQAKFIAKKVANKYSH